MSVQPGVEERLLTLHISNPAPHCPPPHLHLQVAPTMRFSCLGAPLVFVPLPSHRPCDPSAALPRRDPLPSPRGSCRLLEAARPFPRPLGMPSDARPSRDRLDLHTKCPCRDALTPSSPGPSRPLFPSKAARTLHLL